jgi:hypothetical protein
LEIPQINEVIDYGIEAANVVEEELDMIKASVTSVGYALIKKPKSSKKKESSKTTIKVRYQDIPFTASDLEEADKKMKEAMDKAKRALLRKARLKESEIEVKVNQIGEEHGVTFPWVDLIDFSADKNGKVTWATVDVEIIVYLPKWSNIGKKCKPVKDEWNRFLEEVKVHENVHVNDEKSIYNEVHKEILNLQGANEDEVNDKINDIFLHKENLGRTASDTFHNNTPKIVIDTTIKCPK